LEYSIITDNIATQTGGRIRNDNLMYLYGCIITNNRATDGGGIYTPTVDWALTYTDDVTVNPMTFNSPNNFGGKAYTPA